MSGQRRIQQEAAWLLHHRPFRDSSRILDVFSREHGRLALVARGSRSGRSKLKGILRPFLPLKMSWVIKSDMGTLTGAELAGSPISLQGDALLSAYYVNELLLNLLHRHDAQPEVFDLYGETIRSLIASDEVTPVLRTFEMNLLRLLGYGLNLDHDTRTGEPLDPEASYEYHPETGPVEVPKDRQGNTYSGAELVGIRDGAFADLAVLGKANRLLRDVIAWHLDGKELKSRKVLKELRRSAPADNGNDNG